jgi:hypothetical protein
VCAYLFVITRDVVANASAAFTLRSALAHRRRGNRVIVFLVDDAVTHQDAADSDQTVAGLVEAGIEVHAEPRILACLRRSSARAAITPGDDADLGALLLEPGVATVWC